MLAARGEEYLPGVERRDPLPSVLGQTEAVERRVLPIKSPIQVESRAAQRGTVSALET